MFLYVVADEVVPTKVKVGPSNRLQLLAAELLLQRFRSLRVSPCVVRLQKRRCQGQVLLLPPALQAHEVVDLEDPGALVPFGVHKD